MFSWLKLPIFSILPLVVKVPTENQKTPIYFSFIDQSGCNTDSVREILQFDLDNNGISFTTKHKSDLKFEVELKSRELTAYLASEKKGIAKEISLPLSGSLNRDRALLHQLTDKVSELLLEVRVLLAQKYCMHSEIRELGGLHQKFGRLRKL